MNPKQEARDIMKEFGLKQVQISFLYNKEAVFRNCFKIGGDSKALLQIPPAVFFTLVNRYTPSHVFELVVPGDNSGGYGPRNVWFVTDTKLRIQTETEPSGSFMNDILYPSYMAQKSKVVERIGNRETTFEELTKLNREMGFEVFDPISAKWVEKIRLLPPNKAKKHKDTLFLISPKTEKG